MIRLLALAVLAVAVASGARAQHAHAAPPTDPDAALDAIAEAFVVTGLRVDEADPPPGSAVGRAGLRYADGGYVSVVYGRPYARGRQVWGGLVGYDGVWVAGAHRATELVTTVPLAVGEARLEPGAYSVFVTPRADGPWTLHVNRRLGMHLADEYDPAEDAATAEAVSTPAAFAEGLTWAFADDGSALTLAWADRTVAFPVSRADP